MPLFSTIGQVVELAAVSAGIFRLFQGGEPALVEDSINALKDLVYGVLLRQKALIESLLIGLASG